MFLLYLPLSLFCDYPPAVQTYIQSPSFNGVPTILSGQAANIQVQRSIISHKQFSTEVSRQVPEST